MEYLQIVDWEQEQSYRKDRGTPPWIKVYRNKMTNVAWSQLSDSEKGQFICIQLIAADSNGIVPADPVTLKKIAILDNLPNINKFIELGFLGKVGCQDANQMTTKCQPDDNQEIKVVPQDDNPETEKRQRRDREETDYATAADFIFQERNKIHPDHKPPDFKKWEKDIRWTVEMDKRTIQEIKEMYLWVTQNGFWKGVCLSPADLRKHWDKIKAQQTRKQDPAKQTTGSKKLAQIQRLTQNPPQLEVPP